MWIKNYVMVNVYNWYMHRYFNSIIGGINI